MGRLRRDKTIITLPADKGNSTVVMDREDYDKRIDLVLSEGAYAKIPRDPTKKVEKMIHDNLQKLLRNKEITRDLRQRLEPSHSNVPFLYGLPKVHKADIPMLPIVNTRGSPTYNLAQHLAGVIAPLTGKTSSFVKNAPHFVEKVNKLKVPDSTIMVNFDVKSLFTNVPILEALHVIRRQLESDDTLSSRSTMNTSSIIELLHICLTTTYFSFEGQYYQQNDGAAMGAAMGSPLSPIVANIYMEHFEKIPIQTANKTPSMWLQYVDLTFCTLLKILDKISKIVHKGM